MDWSSGKWVPGPNVFFVVCCNFLLYWSVTSFFQTLVASLMSLMASLVTTSRMQQCFNVLIDIYHEFLLLFYCCVLLEIKLTTTTTTSIKNRHTWISTNRFQPVSNLHINKVVHYWFDLNLRVVLSQYTWTCTRQTRKRLKSVLWNSHDV